MIPMSHLDDLIKEFLLFRGFMATYKAFEADIKNEKEKGFRVDKLMETVTQYITNQDLIGLTDLWTNLNRRLFDKLETQQQQVLPRIEAGIFKLYLVNCIQNKRPEKVKEFFERMTSELQNQAEWKDWFVLPFISQPESIPTFSPYFSRQWQDTLMLSLHNFLSMVFSCLPAPRLAEFHVTANKIRRLKDENDIMKKKLSSLDTMLRQKSDMSLSDLSCPDVQPPSDIVDDFFTIAQSNDVPNHENQAKTLKHFLRNITGGNTASGAQPGSVKSQATSQNKAAQKSRSSSKSRNVNVTTSGGSTSGVGAHAPVTRLSATKLTSPGSSSNLLSTLSSSSSRTSPVGDNVEKMAYLLLGQEEYLEHHAEVTQCRFSSSGYVIASGDANGVIKVWTANPDPNTQATFVTQGAITGLEWIPNSERHFLYGTENGVVKLCDKNDRRTTHEIIGNVEGFTGSNSKVRTLACSPTASVFAVSVTQDSGKEQFLLYDLKTMVLDCDLFASLPSSPQLTSCSFNHNSQMIVASGNDGKIRIFDLRQKDCIASWCVNETSGILNIALSEDQTSVYALTPEGEFSAWSIYQSGQRLFQYKLDDPYFDANTYQRSSWSKAMALAGDGAHLLVCSTSGGVIYEFNSIKIEKLLGLKGHRDYVTCCDWSLANECGPCITGAKDGQLKVSTLLSQ